MIREIIFWAVFVLLIILIESGWVGAKVWQAGRRVSRGLHKLR